MSYTTVDVALDTIRDRIAAGKLIRANLVAEATVQETGLTDLPSEFAAEIAEIQAFTPTGAVETEAQDKLAKYTTEFTALKADFTFIKNI